MINRDEANLVISFDAEIGRLVTRHNHTVAFTGRVLYRLKRLPKVGAGYVPSGFHPSGRERDQEAYAGPGIAIHSAIILPIRRFTLLASLAQSSCNRANQAPGFPYRLR